MSSSSIPDNLTLRFSPGPAHLTLSSSQYTARTLTGAFRWTSKVLKSHQTKLTSSIMINEGKNKGHKESTLFGITNKLSPSRTLPDSTLPMITVPMSLNLSIIGNLQNRNFKHYINRPNNQVKIIVTTNNKHKTISCRS